MSQEHTVTVLGTNDVQNTVTVRIPAHLVKQLPNGATVRLVVAEGANGVGA